MFARHLLVLLYILFKNYFLALIYMQKITVDRLLYIQYITVLYTYCLIYAWGKI